MNPPNDPRLDRVGVAEGDFSGSRGGGNQMRRQQKETTAAKTNRISGDNIEKKTGKKEKKRGSKPRSLVT